MILKERRRTDRVIEYDAVVNDVVVGLVQLRPRPSAADGVPDRLANQLFYQIEKQFRGRGLGHKIIGAAIAAAKKEGLLPIRVSVLESNPASIRVIERAGGRLHDQGETEVGHMRLYMVDA